MKKLLGLDIGTTSLKAAVFSETGERLGLKCVDYTLDTDAATGFIELDAMEYVSMCRRVTDEFIEEFGTLDAISLDTQGETMVFADGEGKPLYPAVNWLDNRASAEAEEIKAHFGNKKVYEYTGQPEISAGWPACKVLWFKKNRPDIWEKTKKIFLLEDWIMFHLTGNAVTEPTIQSSTIWYDVVRRCWWQEMLDFIGMTKDVLPELKESAEQVGFYRGIPVIAGALDQIAGTLGCGVYDDSRISEMTGTIMAICALTDKLPPYRADSIIPCHMHAIKGKYCLILWSSTAGMALKWFKNNLAEQFTFRQLDELAEKIPAGCEGLTMLPYFCGSTMPKYNPDVRAVFAGLELGHTRAHMARAIMEAVAFTLKQDLDYIGAENVKEIRITGGGASSPLWAGIKADVTGKVLNTVSESETACLGSALIAGVGIGLWKDICQASAEVTSPKKEYRPSGTDYTEAFRRYEALDDLMNRR